MLSDCIPLSIAAILLLILMQMPVGRWHEAKLSYMLFRIMLPALFCVPFAIKVIPIPIINEVLFREIMSFLFRVDFIIAWSLLIQQVRIASLSPVAVIGVMCVLLGLAYLAGLATTFVPYELNRMLLGVFTAAFLLFSVISFCRNYFDYIRPSDLDQDLLSMSDNLDEACRKLGDSCSLTQREIEVLQEIARGHASSYVAKSFGISNNTARSHMKSIYRKLGISSREELAELIWRPSNSK